MYVKEEIIQQQIKDIRSEFRKLGESLKITKSTMDAIDQCIRREDAAEPLNFLEERFWLTGENLVEFFKDDAACYQINSGEIKSAVIEIWSHKRVRITFSGTETPSLDGIVLWYNYPYRESIKTLRKMGLLE